MTGEEIMNKRQFYKSLAEKYDLPIEYIRFKVDPIYIWNGNKKLSMDELNAIEIMKIIQNFRLVLQFI